MKKILLIYSLLILNYSFCRSRSNIEINTQAPKINITDWIKNTQKNKDLTNRIVVLEFWATWCTPCIKAIPHLNKILKEFEGNSNIVFLSISEL